MRIVEYNGYEFDVDVLIKKDKGGKRLIEVVIAADIQLDELGHEEIITKFEVIRDKAAANGYPDYKVIETYDDISDYTTMNAVIERTENDDEYEDRLVKNAYRKKKQQEARDKKKKAQEAIKKAAELKDFYDNEYDSF